MHARQQRRSRPRDLRCLVRVGFIAILAATGCQPTESRYFGATTPRHGPDELWINNGSEPEWLDPNTCSDGAGGEILWNTFAGLVQAHPATLEPMPEIATHWDVSADGRMYTFHLRPSLWSDGRPLTAHDFVYSFRRLVDPATASKYASNGAIFKGGAAVCRGEAAPETLGVRAIDDLTLHVELEDPLPYFLPFLTFYSFMPIPRHLFEDLDRRGIDAALEDAVRHVHDWEGGTRIGAALRDFNLRWARRILGRGAIVLLISDGWDRGDPALLSREIARLHRSAHRLIWLNPRLGAPGYTPLVRGMQAALPHLDAFLPVHNLISLEQLAAALTDARLDAPLPPHAWHAAARLQPTSLNPAIPGATP